MKRFALSVLFGIIATCIFSQQVFTNRELAFSVNDELDEEETFYLDGADMFYFYSYAFVSLQIDNDVFDWVNDCDVEVILEVTTYDVEGNSTLQAETLYVAHNTSMFDTNIDKSYVKYDDVHRIHAKVIQIKVDGNTVTDAPVNLAVQLDVVTDCIREFEGFTSVPASVTLLDPVHSGNTTLHELTVSWNDGYILNGAMAYELEWTFVDANNASPRKWDFNNNSTRIRTTATSYKIPLLYPQGDIIYRVRAVGKDYQNPERELFGEWTLINTGTVDPYGDYNYTILSTYIEPFKNWQSTISFAEDGKRRESMTYFDGSLRSRQAIVRLNTDENWRSVISQNIYDHTGRPAVTVLPVPDMNKAITYRELFSCPKDTNTIPYRYIHFEVDDAEYSTNIVPMDASCGASKYYSSQNSVSADFPYIPDAAEFPFSVVEYMNDNTNRISRQGSFGEAMQISGYNRETHETKYYYSVPAQDELSRLFGNEAGYYMHYKKNVVIDPNGQASVSYLDPYGRVIATALAGDPDDSPALISLDNVTPFTVQREFTSQLASDGKSLTVSENFVVISPATYTVHYSFTPQQYEDSQCLDNICYDCVYNLTIQIISRKSVEELDISEQIGEADTLVNVCQSLSGYEIESPDGYIDVALDAGDYTIIKILEVDNEAALMYQQHFMNNNTCIQSQELLMQNLQSEFNYDGCLFNCDSCWARLNRAIAFRNKYDPQHPDYDPNAEPGHYLITDAEIDAWERECKLMCNSLTPCDILYEQMIADVSPGGQYATHPLINGGIDKYSVLYTNSFTLKLIDNFRSDDIDYTTITGEPYLILYDELQNTPPILPGETSTEISGLLYITPNQLANSDDFLANWQPHWPHLLVVLHPEYNYWQCCQNYTESFDYSNDMYNTQTADDALDEGFFNPLNIYNYIPNHPLGALPSISDNTTNIDPISTINSTLSDLLEDELEVTVTHQSTDYSIWEILIHQRTREMFMQHDDCDEFTLKDWALFRAIYIERKNNLIFSKIVDSCDVNTAGVWIPWNDNKERRFFPEENIASTSASSAFDVTTDGDIDTPDNLIETVDDNINQECSTLCEAYAIAWVMQLEECLGINGLTQLQFDAMIEDLVSVCTYGCAEGNPLGANSTTDPLSPYDSFEDVLDYYIGSANYTLNCNPLVISFPLSPDHSYTDLVEPDSCACNLFYDAYVEFTFADPVEYCDFSSYMLGEYGFNLNFETDILCYCDSMMDIYLTDFYKYRYPQYGTDWTTTYSELEAFCSRTDYSPQILVPASSTCHCVDCIELKGLWTSFRSGYSALSPLNEELLPLFLVYLNDQANFNFTMSDLNNMLDTCDLTGFTVVDMDECDCLQLYETEYRKRYPDDYMLTGMYLEDPANCVPQPGSTIDGLDFQYSIELDSLGNQGPVALGLWGDIYNELAVLTYYVDDTTLYVNLRNINTFYSLSTPLDTNFTDFTVKITPYNNSALFELLDSLQQNVDYESVPVYGHKFLPNIFPHDACYCHNQFPITAYADTISAPFITKTSNKFTRNCNTWLYEIDCIDQGCAERDTLINCDALADFFTAWNDFTSTHGDISFVDFVNLFGGYDLTQEELDAWADQCNTISGTNWTTCTSYHSKQVSYFISYFNSFLANYTPITDYFNDTIDVSSYTTLMSSIGFGSACDPSVIITADSTYYSSDWKLSKLRFHFYDTCIMKIVDFYFEFDPSSCSISTGSFNNFSVYQLTSPYYYKNASNSYLTEYFNATIKYNTSNYCYNIPWYILNNALSFENCTAYIAHMGETEIESPEFCYSSMITQMSQPALSCDDEFDMNAEHFAWEQYYQQYEQMAQDFLADYYESCLASLDEVFKMVNEQYEYHYTLYYYDQAGNLVKTIPPLGVFPIDLDANNNRENIKLHKINPSQNPRVVPAHELITNYRYNTLNLLVEQHTHDGGKSLFWYDNLGRIVCSQNEKQRADDFYSYTCYDPLGRIIEVGQVYQTQDMTESIATDPDDLLTWINGGDREQITRTFYDQVYDVVFDIPYDQLFLRNRVASVMYLDEETIFTTDYDNWILNGVYEEDQYKSAIHYSYDIHGNVDLVVYDVPYLERFNRRYYSTQYTYDLLSGNVNKVMYQKDKPDEFYHRYQYDPDNRIMKAETSRNNLLWTEDARYFYYPHGPLLRTELGEQKVQGVDYAYTLQGWLKGVNSSGMMAGMDIGLDGVTDVPSNPNAGVARDAYGFTLDYYFDSDFKDYYPINPGNQNIIKFEAPRGNSDMDYSERSLFNGNISYMTTALPEITSLSTNNAVVPDPMVNFYGYDKLNRLVESFKTNYDFTDTTWNDLIADHYDTYYTYDANGNLHSLLRHSDGSNYDLDALSYKYNCNVDPQSYYYTQINNQLIYVEDGMTQTSCDYDFEGYSEYTYDPIGNLISDSGEEILEIIWNTYGKVTHVIRDPEIPSLKPDLEFWYDPLGNRLCKIVKPKDENGNLTTQEYWTITWYLRDAQGNVMAVYTEDWDENAQLAQFKVTEWDIYGSTRHGVLNSNPDEELLVRLDYGNINYLDGGWIDPSEPSIVWQRSAPDWDEFDHIAGYKYYELTNHLGNVMAVVSDRAIPVQDSQSLDQIEYKLPDYRSVSDYYPFGMLVDGRCWNSVGYEYGFNGKTKDNELKGIGNNYDFGARLYDARIGRWMSVDPMAHMRVSWSPYNFCRNNPILNVDPTGALDDNYSVDDDGNVKKEEDTDDYFDMLYTKSDWDAGNTDNGLKVNDRSILPDLKTKRTNVDGNYAISTNRKEAFNVFYFMANNTNVEWGIDGYRTSGDNEYIVKTSHSGGIPAHVFNSTSIDGYDEFNMIFDMHSHTGTATEPGTKGASGFGDYYSGDMSYITIRYSRFQRAGMKNTSTWFKKDDQWTVFPKHYVYHKQSKVLYHYTPWKNNVFIRNTKKASDLYYNLGF